MDKEEMITKMQQLIGKMKEAADAPSTNLTIISQSVHRSFLLYFPSSIHLRISTKTENEEERR